MEILFLLSLILLNGVFAMSEIALVTAKRARLQRMAGDGDQAAAIAIKLGEEPTRFLSTIQIGITSIGVLSGIVGEAAFAAPFADWLEEVGLPKQVSEYGATGIVVMSVTFLSIIFGELVPKRIGQLNPESIARLVARPMTTLAAATRPFVRLLTFSTEFILKLLGANRKGEPHVTEEEIEAMLAEGSDAGVIEAREHEMLRNVFRLDDRQIGSLMVPRSEIVALDLSLPVEDNMRRIADSERTRFPVCRGSMENVIGVINARRLLGAVLRGERPNLEAILQNPVFVPETLTGMELVEQFRAAHMQMVFVIDEYGQVKGLITLQDLMEAITGELKPSNESDAWAVQRDDGSWLLDGLIPLSELKQTLEVRELPEEDKGRYHTLSGAVMLLLGRLPSTGDKVNLENWTLEVVDLDGRRIDKVLATRRPDTPPVKPDEQGMDA